MTKKKFQFPINYILIGFIVILLIFLRQMDQRVTVLENQIVTVEKVDVVKKEEKAHKISLMISDIGTMMFQMGF